ncbi:MAG TPA: hypothetical protein VM243_07275 [Phycisphaerae bacterium]|nr:hypothetical protein [Phycisphaerae bacterium]
MMGRVCPQCSAQNPALARFCCQCGRALDDAPSGGPGGGSSSVLSCPAGFQPCLESPGFYYQWVSVGKESFFGCEYLGLTLLNGGDPAVEIRIRLTGRDATGEVLFELERNVHRMERGQPASLEIPRDQLPGVPESLDVSVVSSKRSPPDEPQERRQSCKPWWSSSSSEDSS